MKAFNRQSIIKLSLTLIFAGWQSNAMALDSVAALSTGMSESVQASGHIAEGTLKFSAAVVAIPLVVVGSVGAVGSAALAFATDSHGHQVNQVAVDDGFKPLPISTQTITAAPSPKQALAEQVSAKKSHK